jgi:hypothetical protein
MCFRDDARGARSRHDFAAGARPAGRAAQAEGIADRRVLDVIGRLPRHLFIEEALASRAYEDTALPIG